MKSFTAALLLLVFICLSFGFPNTKEQNLELGNHFEGDLLLTAEQQQSLLPGARNGLSIELFRWPENIVYYKITPGHFTEDQEDLILLGMKNIEDASCIRFIEASPNSRSYVKIGGLGSGCYSFVGSIGIPQTVNLQAPGCLTLGLIVHEFMHTLGFFHQQSASDRDKFVKIKMENIEFGAKYNFLRASSLFSTDFDVPYDYGSLMHYGAYAFSKNGEKTIETIDTTAVIGQRDELSPSDILKLNKMYNCP